MSPPLPPTSNNEPLIRFIERINFRLCLSGLFLVLSILSLFVLLKNNTISKLPTSMTFWETTALSCLALFVVAFIQVTAFYNYRYRRDAVILLVLLTFLTGFFWTVAIDIIMERTTPKGYENALALLAVGWAATLGWIVTNWLSRDAAKTTHTLNAVIQLITSKEFQDHRRNIFADIPYNETLSEIEHVDRMLDLYDAYDQKGAFTKDRCPTIDSIRYVFNYFEYVARGIRANEFDNRIVRETIGTMIFRFYDDYKLVFVRSRLEEDQREIYEHLSWLLSQSGRMTEVDEKKLGLQIRLGMDTRRRQKVLKQGAVAKAANDPAVIAAAAANRPVNPA